MTHDSHFMASDPGSLIPENRDNSRDIPVIASAPENTACRLAGLALDLVSDFYRIHRRKFDDRPRGPGEVGRARQVAVALVLRAGFDPWPTASAFGLDLSTVKAARRRVEIREREEPGFAGRMAALEHAFKIKARA